MGTGEGEQREGGEKRMRLEPSEEMMYRRMDWKERLLLLFPLLGILASVGLLLIGSGRWRIWGMVVVGIAAGALAVVWVVYREIQRRIMPLANCFLEVQRDCFVAVQPFRDGEYESCRIYFEEIEGLIEGKKGKGFYVRISGEGRSVVQRKERGKVMFVSSEGYDEEKFRGVYERIRVRIPEVKNIDKSNKDIR